MVAISIKFIFSIVMVRDILPQALVQPNLQQPYTPPRMAQVFLLLVL